MSLKYILSIGMAGNYQIIKYKKMTAFENILIDNGYIKYILNCKTMKYEIAKKDIISSLANIDYRYFHKTDTNVLQKIADGKSITEKDFSWEDRKGEICFGLHEDKKPPTLISPRPKIRVKKERNFNGKKQIVTENEDFDDSMNLVLSKEKPEQILKALFDSSIIFNYDLTDQTLKIN